MTSRSWANSNRRGDLPHNWSRIRIKVFARDGRQCTAITREGTRCTERATDVHHLGDRKDHSLENLASLCSGHHNKETQEESMKGRVHYTRRRPDIVHPFDKLYGGKNGNKNSKTEDAGDGESPPY